MSIDPDRWLLVGSSGRVGRMLSCYWDKSPPIGATITRQYRGQKPPGALDWNPLDGPQALLDYVKENGSFGAMFMLAGITPAPGADLDGNVAIARACLDAAHAAGIPNVLLASSSAVYGPGAALDEAAPTSPINPYGVAKLEMEEICQKSRKLGLNITNLRIGNVAGADVLLLNALKATKDTPLRLDRFSDGQGPIRTYIGPVTLAKVLETLARSPENRPDVLNVGVPVPITMESLVEAAGMPWTFTPAPETAVQTMTLGCARLAQLHKFCEADGLPATMVAQWNELRGDP